MSTAEATTSRPGPTAPARTGADAPRLFSQSIVISGIRCVLTYVVFPWLLPLAGIAGGVGPGIGLGVGTVAIVFNVLSIRRFWSPPHAWRWAITALNGGIIVLLSILLVIDVGDLVS